MGNELSAVAPVQILPVEHYIAELNHKLSHKSFKELEIEKSLTCTRFFKVVKCISEEGPTVVKVFVIHDSSMNLSEHRKKIRRVNTKLAKALNCLPFYRTEITEKAAFIIRPFIRMTLYDRISTRPFLTDIEKKWLTFQLLKGLEQCHTEEICHGDLKLENLLVTSWSWLMISDIATFKPVFLPDDNPTDYTYFFDTSRRRVCHIAPERFKPVGEDGQMLTDKTEYEMDLTPAMDMFSTGAVLTELFTEGTYPFSLHQLLKYRSGEFYPDCVNKLSDTRIKDMVVQMLQKDPQQRKNATYYLQEERGKSFPECFYTFLWAFCGQFAQAAGIPPDERIMRIEESMPQILSTLGVMDEDEKEKEDADEDEEEKEDADEDEEACPKRKNEVLMIIIPLITSSIRSLHYNSSKIRALQLLSCISRHVSDEVILDRILPYVLSLLHDKHPSVRGEAVECLTLCVSLVASVPKSEVNIFPEYIFPLLNDITQDEDFLVRQSEAKHIAKIADTSIRFINYCQGNNILSSSDHEIEMTHDIIQRKLAKLFSDPSNVVKRTLIEHTMNTLCCFFGRDKTNDILLSHLITFLNEKKDYHLRLSFFKNITGIATYMGGYCAPILKPLLLQGLSDTEEMVVIAALNTMSTLTETGIFPDHTVWEFVKESVPLLIHPNNWIRLAVVGYIVAASKNLTLLDVLTMISDAINPFVKEKVIQFRKEECILTQLKDPLPRDAYDTLVRCSDLENILNILEREANKGGSLTDLSVVAKDEDQQTRNLLRRLSGFGLNEEYIKILPHLRDYLLKVHRHKKTMDTLQTNQDDTRGIIDLEVEAKQKPFLLKHFRLFSTENPIEMANIQSISQMMQKSTNLTMNEEWRTMFGGLSLENSFEPKNTSFTNKSTNSSSTISSQQSFMLDQSQIDRSVHVSKCVMECQNSFRELMMLKREETLISLQGQKVSIAESVSLPDKWRPKGHLAAHMHEHRAAITRLIALKGTSLFASSSKDGTVKVWDSNKTERTHPVNRSKYTYNKQKGLITTIAYCPVQESIASASDNSTIQVFQVDKQTIVSSRTLDAEKEGYSLDMQYMEAGSHSILTYSTIYGSIVGWDLRSPNNAWLIENGVRNGVITSYAIDSANNWLACGTTSGIHVCWDLRFMLPISQIKHPYDQGVHRLKLHPLNPSWIVTSVRSNNEVVFWDLETQSRMRTLWASNLPPLSCSNPRNMASSPENWVCGLLCCVAESGGVFAITAGTDSRIRYWDMDVPERSYVISQPSCYTSHCRFDYASRVIDGSEVIIETIDAKPMETEPSDDVTRKCQDQLPTGHSETITDVIMVTNPQKMIISSGYDGTLKMWK